MKEKIQSTDLMRVLCKKSLFFTAKHLCGYKDLTSFTHGKIIQALEEDTKRKLVVCPRGGFKTSLIISYCVWNIIRNPNIRIMIDSELFTNSKNHVGQIQTILESELFVEIFGNYYSKSDWSSSRFTVSARTDKTLKDPTCAAGGVGTRKIGAHADLWILDDMNSPQNTHTIELADKVVNHYKYGLSILEPSGTICLIGTRYSETDLIQWVLDNEINYEGKNESNN